MIKVASVIVNMVPYHHARWEAFAAICSGETHLVELTDRDDFKVLEFSRDSAYRRHTLFPGQSGGEAPEGMMFAAMAKLMEKIRPDVLCVSGWGLPVSLAAMAWAAPRGIPIVMLSESNEFDETRIAWKEFVKRRLVSLCYAGVGGGGAQADYLVRLGLPKERVFTGYDVVDNEYFEKKTDQIRNSGFRFQLSGLAASNPYFFACARFGKKKNIPGLVRAYAQYRAKMKSEPSGWEAARKTTEGSPERAPQSAGADGVKSEELQVNEVVSRGSRVEGIDSVFSLQSSAFDLVIAGDGELRAEIEAAIRDLGLIEHVHLVGAKGYHELPRYYANAAAFIHASTTEQWGLVVNEAMASGLPVLVSNRCGCVLDLVKEGENGWTFDPHDQEQMADLMLKMSSDEEARKRMGKRSQEIISEWGPSRFAAGVQSSTAAALAAPRKKAGILDRMILCGLARK